MKRRTVLSGVVLATTGLAGCFGPPTEYIISAVSAEAGDTPFDMKIDILDADATLEGPARLELSVTNASDEPVRIRNRGVWPFGVLRLSNVNPTENDSWRGAKLMSEAYEESDHVETDADSTTIDGTVLEKSVSSGQTVSEVYTVSGEALDVAAEYSIYGWAEEPWLFEFVRQADDTWTQFLPSTTVSVETPGFF